MCYYRAITCSPLFMKKVVLGLALSVALIASTSCSMGGSGDKDRLVALLVDTVCMTQDATASIMDMANGDFSNMNSADIEKKTAEIKAKGEAMEGKMKDLPKTHGFAQDSDVDAAFGKITDKAAFRKEIEDKAKAKCNPKADMMSSILDNIK